jgi:hypothetical protein
MISMRAIWRFVSTSWLVAAPLIVVALLIVIPLLLAIVEAMVERVFGHAAAESFFDFVFGATMWGAEVALVLAPVALAVYGTICLVRWLVRKKAP